ncbi:MAG TPA: alpha/beta fold hydrolase, partial [Bacteroidetes bacterium]|nr:alpha/beta fold hydrolase [Bacteroidota bacterium]
MDLNFKMAGKGEPVIILHGVFGMLDNWQIVAKKLSEKYWVITLDLRNHGKSPHSDIFNYEVMTDDIVEFMEKHQI